QIAGDDVAGAVVEVDVAAGSQIAQHEIAGGADQLDRGCADVAAGAEGQAARGVDVDRAQAAVRTQPGQRGEGDVAAAAGGEIDRATAGEDGADVDGAAVVGIQADGVADVAAAGNRFDGGGAAAENAAAVVDDADVAVGAVRAKRG